MIFFRLFFPQSLIILKFYKIKVQVPIIQNIFVAAINIMTTQWGISRIELGYH